MRAGLGGVAGDAVVAGDGDVAAVELAVLHDDVLVDGDGAGGEDDGARLERLFQDGVGLHLGEADQGVVAGLADLVGVDGELLLHRGEAVVFGDFWDFPSLSSYDKGKLSFEGRRLKADIEIGNKAMDLLLAPIKQEADYFPRMIFTLGNHEERLKRVAKDNPEMSGFSYDYISSINLRPSGSNTAKVEFYIATS